MRTAWVLVGVVVMMLTSGCTNPPPKTIPIPELQATPAVPLTASFPATDPLGNRTLYLERAAWVTNDQVEAFERAARAWEGTGAIRFSRVAQQPADISVQFIRDWGGETMGQHFAGLAQIGAGDSECGGKWQPFDSVTLEQVSRHELGHALGFQHVNDTGSIMYPYLNRSRTFTLDDQTLIPAGAAMFLGPCMGADTIARFSFNVTSDLPVSLYVIPSQAERDLFKAGEAFRYYRGCSAEQTNASIIACNVPAGGGILVDNRNLDNVPVHTVLQQVASLAK